MTNRIPSLKELTDKSVAIAKMKNNAYITTVPLSPIKNIDDLETCKVYKVVDEKEYRCENNKVETFILEDGTELWKAGCLLNRNSLSPAPPYLFIYLGYIYCTGRPAIILLEDNKLLELGIWEKDEDEDEDEDEV